MRCNGKSGRLVASLLLILTLGFPSTLDITRNDMGYLQELKRQENEILMHVEGLIFPNEPPEDSSTKDIGYGHKLTKTEVRRGLVYGIEYTDGVTEEESHLILAIDMVNHRDRARRVIGDKVWNSLDKNGKSLLTDYSFTGTLMKFPKFRSAITKRDKEGVLKEYERSFTKEGRKVKMKRRNLMALKLINQIPEEYWL